MSAHDRLTAKGITPTIDAERAYRLGYSQAEREIRQATEDLLQKALRLEKALIEIGLLVTRSR